MLVGLLLLVATTAVYVQVYQFEFVNFDDGDYIYNNEMVKKGLTGETVRWAFRLRGYAANWHPLTWLSHMLDIEIYGLDNPGGHHITNIILHIANTLLLFAVFYKMTGAVWRSGLVAGLFALHPLHVESVAWVSERKDVLSSLFWMLTMLFYACYVQRNGSKKWYIAAVIAFAIGLTAKAMLVTLPCVLLLMDYWPLKRFSLGKDTQNKKPGSVHSLKICLLDKIPFFILTVFSSIITFIVQRRWGAVEDIEVLSFSTRLLNTFSAYIKYIIKMFYPVRLANFYPYPQSLSIPFVIVSMILLISITVAVVWFIRKQRFWAVGWFWYLGTLIPVIGLVQVGEQEIADRYTYIPLIGLFIMVAWGLGELRKRVSAAKPYITAATGIAMVALAGLTYRQVGFWENNFTLLEHAIAVTEGNYECHFCLADPLIEEGRIDEAIEHTRRAIEIKEDYLKGQNGMGYALLQKGQPAEAIPYLLRAIEIEPKCYQAHVNLAIAYRQTGQFQKALKHFHITLQNEPSMTRIYANIAEVHTMAGNIDQALTYYQKFLQAQPNSPNIIYSAGVLYAQKGDFASAAQYFENALQFAPEEPMLHANLGLAYSRLGYLKRAENHYQTALKLSPNMPEVHHNYGNMLFQLGNHESSLGHLQKAAALAPDSPEISNDLGVAYLQLKQYEKAQQAFEKAIQLRPQFVDPYANLGVVLLQQAKYDRAEHYLKKAIELSRNQVSAYYNLGLVYGLSGKTDQAIEMMNKVLTLSPSNPNPHIKLAEIYRDQGRLDKAIEHALKACRLTNHQNPYFLAMLGECYASAGQTDSARQAYNKALEIAIKLNHQELIEMCQQAIAKEPESASDPNTTTDN